VPKEPAPAVVHRGTGDGPSAVRGGADHTIRSNIPVIIVVWRQSDASAYWKDVTAKGEERRLKFDNAADMFDARCAETPYK
jgi:hypothetical protein